MNNLEKKIDLLVSLALAEDDETRESLKGALFRAVMSEDATTPRSHTVKSEVCALMQEIGVRSSLRGYDAVVLAVCLVVNDPNLRYGITTNLYPAVAKEIGSSSIRVERCIRHAIETAWDGGDLEVFEKYFGNTVSRHRGKPTNSEFISQMAHHIRQRLEEQ